MKKLLTVIMMSICMASLGQSKSDSVTLDNAKIEIHALRSLNDSLASKINKMLIFHYYACQIIQTINSDGSIRSRKDFIEAVREYREYYHFEKKYFMRGEDEFEIRNNTGKPIKKWQIWIGAYHLGQGYDPPSKPQMIA